MTGESVGPYTLLNKLGEGGMGEVYKARDTRLGRIVAVKCLPASKVAEADRRQRFLQEAQAASALNHPGIVTIHDWVEHNGNYYLVMEYLVGKTLDQLIPRRGLRLTETLRLASQIAGALAAAHAAGIIHRDIKPSNIMVSGEGRVKVLDFGLAKLEERESPGKDDATLTVKARSEEGTVAGSAPYMSPEQADGKKIDARSDIFSFGAVLYEMVTGQRAFQGDSRVSTMAAILKSEPKPAASLADGLPKELERILTRCLRKDIERRSQSIREIKLQLEELLAESESGGQPAAPGAMERPRPWKRWAAISAGAVVLALAAVGVWTARVRGTGPGVHYDLRPLISGRGSHRLPAASPDGKYIAYVSDRTGDENIWIQPGTGGDPVQLTHGPEPSWWPQFSPDGSRLVYHRRSGIYTFTLVGNRERHLLDSENVSNPQYSPDGRWIAYKARTAATEIRIMPSEGGPSRKLYAAEDVAIDGPVWAPDGSCLLIAAGKSGIGGLVEASDWKLLPVSGGDPVLVEGMPSLRQASTQMPYPKNWLPESWHVVFGAALRQSHIWRVRLSPRGQIESAVEQISYGTREHPGPASRDGKVIPFSTGNSAQTIYAMPIDAANGAAKGDPVPVLNWDVTSYFPSVTPDGRKMVFVSERSGNFDIWMRDNQTKEETPLTTGPFQETRALLSGDGKRVAWQRYENGKRPVFWKELPDGPEKRVVEDCRAVLGWTSDNTGFLVSEANPEHWSVFDTVTGRKLPTAIDDRRAINQVTLSPDGKWFAFTLQPEFVKGSRSKLMVSRWHQDRATRAAEWTQLGGDDDYFRPFWSLDGRLLYYFKFELTERSSCLYARQFDPAAGRATGNEITVRHLHGNLRTWNPNYLGYGLTPDTLYLSLAEPGGQVWIAEASAPDRR